MNIAIVDDFVQDCQILVDFLHDYCQKNSVLANIDIFYDGESILEGITKQSYDIIFLDIYMSGMDGMETAQKIRELDSICLIVFSTSSDRHAVKSFRVRAFDYLVKPYGYDQFEEVMSLCEQALLKKARYIEIKEGRSFTNIFLRDIIYADYYNHYVQIHTKQRVVKSYMPFRTFSEILSPYPQFLYCYRNCIVNMDEVASLDDRDFILHNNERVPISRAQRAEIRRAYSDYAFKKLDRD